MLSDTFDAVFRLLDADLIDRDGRRSGKVDDLEFDGAPGEDVHLTALLSGRPLLPDRLPRPLRPWARHVFGREPVWGSTAIRVPWAEVEGVTAVVSLLRPAAELGLGQGDDVWRPIISKLPGA
jgi:sporulation protein YlmC with PRC-barrel domain